MKELEELVESTGLFNEHFSCGVGDMMMEVSDEDEENSDRPEQPLGKKPKPQPFPSIEGSESCHEFVQKYKKACLNRKGVFKTLAEKWQAAGLSTTQPLAFIPKKNLWC